MNLRNAWFGTLAVMLAIGLGAMALTPRSAADPERTDPSRLEVSSLTKLLIPPLPPPTPRFTRTTYAATDLGGALPLLDKCKGPVAIWLGIERPTLISEHDYCGGSSWMSKLKVGEAVKIDGEGIDEGTFVVTSLTYETRKEVTVGDLPEADAVLQTCVTKTKLVLVALERFEA